MQPIVFRTATQYWVRLAVIWAIFGLIGFGMIAGGRLPLLKPLGVAVMLFPAWMPFARWRGWVARLDGDGAVLVSGRRLPWSEFETVIDHQITRGGAYRRHNHYELRFRSGRGYIFDAMVANRDDAVRAMAALMRGKRPAGGALVQ